MTMRMRWPAWRSLLWLVAGLALIVAMRKGELDYAGKLAPLSTHGVLKQRIVARNFAVTADGFRLAHGYRIAGADAQAPPRVLSTPGVWVSVVLEAEALHEPGMFNARIRTREGLIYQANGDGRPRARGVNLSGIEVAPGLPATGAFFFEMPPAQLPGAHLQVYWGGLTPAGMDSLVDIDLGTGARTSDELAAQTAVEIDLRP